MIEVKGKYASAKIFADNVDEGTIGQITALCNQEFVSGSSIRVMPDTHVGIGCTIGTTMTITDKVVPGHVGVDIGCGVYVGRITGEIDFDALDKVIRTNVPAGFDVRNSAHRLLAKTRLKELKCQVHLKNMRRLELSLGSLGGGNHFIEVAKDDSDNHYLLIHTGSRNLGKQISEYYQALAASTLCKKGVSKDMAYLEGDALAQYLHDMQVAQEFADLNRQAIAEVIARGMNWSLEDAFITTHNYIDLKTRILRKGAVSASSGEKLVIPINMRDGSIIACGKGNPDWNYSAPHGAGRLMSRSQAKRALNMEEYKQAMSGIYTTTVGSSTLDEAPMAYKPMQQILDQIGETVDILTVIRPVYNFKAAGD